jgi:DNA-directed RNA polymerase specialized sigma24 family protein
VDALARSLADGGTEGLLAAYDRYADHLYAYGCVLLADEDAVASAVQDAFLVAAERAAGLPEAARLVPWLYALTRNECLRRRPSRTAAGPQRELAELVRHGLAAADVAAVLGVEAMDTVESLDRLPPPEAVAPPAVPPAPAALRDRLAAAVEGSTAAERTTLARRAGPFQAGGFPQPLDRRRLSGRVLAASIAAAVLGTLALLAGVPSLGPGASGAAPAGVGDLAAAPAVAGPPLAGQSSWPAPNPAPAVSLQPTVPARPASTVAAPDPATSTGPRPAPPTHRTAAAAPVVLGWLENRTAPNCPPRWTARVHVVVDGVDPDRVLATWFDGDRIQTVVLRHHGLEWIGDLGGIPVGERLWWRAAVAAGSGEAAGTLTQPLAYTCARPPGLPADR